MRSLWSLSTALLLTLAAIACDQSYREGEGIEDVIHQRGLDPLCDDACTPLLQNCDAGESCQWTGEDWACADAGNGDHADPCSVAGDCSAGLLCVEGDLVAGCSSTSCCTWVCDADDNFDACPGAGRCVDVFVGDGNPYGLCIVPQLPEIETPFCGLQEVPYEQSKK